MAAQAGPSRSARRVRTAGSLTEREAAMVLDRLDIVNNTAMAALPDGLVCHKILANDTALETLGARVRCRELVLDGSKIGSIPDGTEIAFRLSARDCQRLRALPAGLRAGVVDLRGCLALEALPAGLSPCFLDLDGCSSLAALPDDLDMRGGRLALRGCSRVAALPPAGRVAQLDVADCLNIRAVPEGFHVTSWIDVGGSGIAALPRHLRGVGVRWRGVPIDERIAFRPEELSVEEILAERNAEVRRVMLERFGFEAFMAAAAAEVLDRDRDPGGPRELLRVAIAGDEPLVCVSVSCPSTGRRYVLRVPPDITTCRHAVAWTAGFDDPRDYAPLLET